MLALPAPGDDAVGADDDERAVRDAGRLEVDAEGARRLALGLEVREHLDRDAELLAERASATRRWSQETPYITAPAAISPSASS